MQGSESSSDVVGITVPFSEQALDCKEVSSKLERLDCIPEVSRLDEMSGEEVLAKSVVDFNPSLGSSSNAISFTISAMSLASFIAGICLLGDDGLSSRSVKIGSHELRQLATDWSPASPSSVETVSTTSEATVSLSLSAVLD